MTVFHNLKSAYLGLVVWTFRFALQNISRLKQYIELDPMFACRVLFIYYIHMKYALFNIAYIRISAVFCSVSMLTVLLIISYYYLRKLHGCSRRDVEEAIPSPCELSWSLFFH